MRAIYVGAAIPASAASHSDAVRVEAALAPRLVACVPPAAHGAVGSIGGPLAFQQAPIAKKRKQSNHALRKAKVFDKVSYYVCTLESCNWRGSGLNKHRKQRPACPGYPCVLYHAKGASSKDAAMAFLARCTAQQRKHGLPPDGAKPIPLRGRNGLVDPDVWYLTVPIGLKAGDSFTVPMAAGMEARLIVPSGKAEGDVLSISARSGKQSRQPVGILPGGRVATSLGASSHASAAEGGGSYDEAVDEDREGSEELPENAATSAAERVEAVLSRAAEQGEDVEGEADDDGD